MSTSINRYSGRPAITRPERQQPCYSCIPTSDLEPGDVVLHYFEFADPDGTGGKRRPAVIDIVDGEVIAFEVHSDGGYASRNGGIPIRRWREASLQWASVVRLDRSAPLRQPTTARIGRLTEMDFKATCPTARRRTAPSS